MKNEKIEEIVIKKEYALMYVYYNKSNNVAKIKIDTCEVERVKKYKWSYSMGYLISLIDKKFISLHAYLLGSKKGFVIDHINGDTLDNRKINLRHITHKQNLWNNKGKGYYYNKPAKKYQVKIMKDGKFYHIGYFDKEKEAIQASKEAKVKIFGEYSRYYHLNTK